MDSYPSEDTDPSGAHPHRFDEPQPHCGNRR